MRLLFVTFEVGGYEFIGIQPGQLDELTYVTIDLFTMKLDRIQEQYVN